MWRARVSSQPSRSALRMVRYGSRSAILAWGFHCSRQTRSLTRSLLPRVTAREWDCGSAAPLLNRTAGACGLLRILRKAQHFISLYLLGSNDTTQLCQKSTLNLPTAFTPTTRRADSMNHEAD